MSASHPASIIARCFCGSAQLPVRAPLPAPINCHCRQCRRLSGAAFTTWVSMPLADCTLPDAATLSEFKPTENLTRWFCHCCGGHLFTQDSRMPGVVGIPAGVLPDEAMPAPIADYFTDHRAAWHAHVPLGVPQFGGETGYSPVTQATK